MTLKFRAFNESGTEAAIAYIESLRQDEDVGPPSFLVDEQLSAEVGGAMKVPKDDIPTRWHLGAWLYREVERSITEPEVLRTPGFWTWIALAVFPTIRPIGTPIREDARYILKTDDYRKRYRHLISGPYFVFAAHQLAPHIIKAALATPPHAPGDLYEQFASRQELITSAAVMELVSTMYWDSDRSNLKSGASSNARRLADVLMQYQVTYDFGAIQPTRLLEMLPREFRRFKPKENR